MTLTRRQAAIIGKRIEMEAIRILELHGYECARADLSRFPDVIYWDRTTTYFLEVKFASTRASYSAAKTSFKKATKERAFFPLESPVQLWIFYAVDELWHVWGWVGGTLISKGEHNERVA